MPLEIITGAERSGKKRFLLKKAGVLIRSEGSERLIILVPTQAAARTIPGKILEETNLKSILTPGIYTFENLAEKIIREADTKIGKIDTIRSQYLISEIINDRLEREEIEFFAESAPRKGFLNFIHNFIESMKQAEIPPEMILADLKGKRSALSEAVSIYKSYQDHLLDNNLYDNSGLFWKAEDTLRKTVPEFLKKSGVLMIYGFTSFTYIQRNIIEILKNVIPTVMLSLCYEDDPKRKDLFDETANIIDSLKGILPVKMPSADEKDLWCFRELERNLFKTATSSKDNEIPGIPPSREGIRLFSAPDIPSEMEAVSSRIKNLILESGYSPDEITVVCPSIKNYGKYISRAMTSAGIPFSMPTAVPFDSTPLGVFISKVIQSSIDDVPRKELKTLAGSRFLYMFYRSFHYKKSQPDESILTMSEFSAEAENQIENSSISRGTGSWLEHFSTLASIQASPFLKTVSEVLIEFIKIQIDLRNTKDIAGAGVILNNLMERVIDRETVIDYQNRRTDNLERKTADSLNALFGLTLPSIKKEPDRSSCTPIRNLLFAAERTEIEPDIHSEGKVLITNPYAFRGRRTKALFFAGLNNGIFPKYQQPGTIPFRSEILKLGNEYVSRLPRKLDSAQDQMILFYSVLCSADELITLSWVQNDEDDKSLFISDVMHAVEGLEIEAEIPFCLKPEYPGITNESQLFQALQISSLKQIPSSSLNIHTEEDGLLTETGADETVPASYLKRNFERYYALSAVENTRNSDEPPGIYDGVLSSPSAVETVKKKFGGDLNFTASMFNDFGECPFEFFAAHVLKLRIVDEKEDEFRPMDEGAAVHSILRSFYSQLLAKKDEYGIGISAIDRNEILDLLDGTIDEYFRESEIHRKVVFTDFLDSRKAEMKKTLRRFVNSDLDRLERYVPAMFETGFGKFKITEDMDPASTREPVTVEYEDENINLAGKIDRADIDTQGRESDVLVLDYKQSSFPKRDELARGLDFQLQIYLLAAEKIASRIGLKLRSLGAQYCSIKSTERGKNLILENGRMIYLGREKFDITDLTRKYMFGYKKLMYKGFFPPYPKKDCGYCGMRTLCRFSVTRTELKKARGTEDEP